MLGLKLIHVSKRGHSTPAWSPAEWNSHRKPTMLPPVRDDMGEGLVHIYKVLRFQAGVPRATVFSFIPRSGDGTYLLGLIDRTSKLLGNFMGNKGYDQWNLLCEEPEERALRRWNSSELSWLWGTDASACCLLHIALQGRHNERDGVSNHQPHDCLLKRLFRRRSKKTSKLRVTGLCEGNSSVADEFPAQRASNAANVSIWWRHHGHCVFRALFRAPQLSQRNNFNCCFIHTSHHDTHTLVSWDAIWDVLRHYNSTLQNSGACTLSSIP